MGLAPIERDTLDRLVNDSPRRILARMHRLGHKSTLKEARALKDFGTLTAMIVGLKKQRQEVPQVVYAKLEALRCALPKALRNELSEIR
jgi:hypothetical protein